MDDEVFYAVGLQYGIIKAVFNGTCDFAIKTAKYYRQIGYNAKVLTCEQFDSLNEI